MAKPPVVILTGAGISAESGIKTFRASDGLWENHRIEEVATPQAFKDNPSLVHRFYNQRRRQLLSGIQPNNAHHAIAKFSEKYTGDVILVTQNVDNLHQRAGGNLTIYPMHGELCKVRCSLSGEIFDCLSDTNQDVNCSCCQKKGNLRPHIVWFGEMPFFLKEINLALSSCSHFIAIGTSGHVYPAAGFHQTAKHHGAITVEINLQETTSSSLFDQTYVGTATEKVPEFLSKLLKDT